MGEGSIFVGPFVALFIVIVVVWAWLDRRCGEFNHAMVRSIHERDAPSKFDPLGREVLWYCDKCGKVEWLNALVGYSLPERDDRKQPQRYSDPTDHERALVAESRRAYQEHAR